MFKMVWTEEYYGVQCEFFKNKWAMKERYLNKRDGCCWNFHFYDANGEEIKI